MTGEMLRKRTLALACVLLLAACGGDGGGSDPDAVSDTTAEGETTIDAEVPATTQPAEDEPSEAPEDDGEASSSTDVNKAIVTIGDQTYEFDAEMHVVGRCDPDFFGAFWVIAAMADGSGGNLEMLLIPEGNTLHDETSKIKVDVEESDERDWRADEDGGEGTPAGESRVESINFDGGTVSGTATFVDVYSGDGVSAEGTFEATCPEN